MQVVVHKGTSEIGGNCIELTCDGSTILLDLGLPLKKCSDPVAVARLRPEAVLVSHPHQDHYGLIEGLGRDVPVYLSELGKRLIDAARIFTRQPLPENDFHFINPKESFSIGPFTVTPFLMDHSSPTAFAFLVEAGGVRVLYSGDFRAHGRKGILFERFVQKPPPNIDLLLMEGTMLNRSSDGFPDERAVEESIVEVLKNQRNTSFIICSSQNIDRIVSAFRACRRTGKMLVVDVYTAWALEQMKLVSESVPNMFWDEVKVYVPNSQYQVVKDNPEFFGDFRSEIFKTEHRVNARELETTPSGFLQVIRVSGARSIKRYLGEEPVNIIYSQWLGYLEQNESPPYGADELSRLRNDPRVNFIYAHTGGHAVLEDLKRFAEAISPGMLVPIHTEFKDDFKEHFENVLVMKDGEEIEIGHSSNTG